MAKRPNILFIMTDNQPADMLGCYGNDEIPTPHNPAYRQARRRGNAVRQCLLRERHVLALPGLGADGTDALGAWRA